MQKRKKHPRSFGKARGNFCAFIRKFKQSVLTDDLSVFVENGELFEINEVGFVLSVALREDRHLADDLAARFRQLEAQYPGLRFVPLMDQGEYIYMIVNSILESLLTGAVFAILVLLLFLKDLRPTIVVAFGVKDGIEKFNKISTFRKIITNN